MWFWNQKEKVWIFLGDFNASVSHHFFDPYGFQGMLWIKLIEENFPHFPTGLHLHHWNPLKPLTNVSFWKHAEKKNASFA